MLTALLLLSALLAILSIDLFIAGLSYGAGGVKVPPLSILSLSLTGALLFSCSVFLGRRLFAESAPEQFARISFCLLMLLALYKLYEILPHDFCKCSPRQLSDRVNKKMPSLLSPGEAALLSVVLSLDSVMAGLTCTTPVTPALLFPACILLQSAAFAGGVLLGKRLSRIGFNFSWLSVLLFFLLALSRLF